MRNIPIVTKNLLLINLVVFLVTLLMPGLDDWLGLHFVMAPDFQVYQLFTYMFMHAGFSHIFFNMFALWMFGCVVERVWGPRRFLLYYLVCGVGAGLFQELAQIVQFYSIMSSSVPNFSLSQLSMAAQVNGEALNAWTTVGASGAVYGILLAFGMTFPEERIFIFPLPVPIKAKWFVVLYAGVEIAMALGTPGDGVAHLAHLGGMAFGFFLIRYWRRQAGVRGNTRAFGAQFFDSLRSSWERRSHRGTSDGSWRAGREDNPDWEYNARKKREQEEIDRILDKIRRNGYDSLSREEKQRLFDSSRK